jgi:hypothetical protein
MRRNAVINCAVLLVLALCLALIPYVLASGTLLVTDGMNVTLNKTDNFDPVNASSYLTYTINITVTNLSSTLTNISNLTLTENYSQYIIFNNSQPTAVAGTNNTFILGNITVNTTIQVNITVFVLNITNGTVINNTANISFFTINSIQWAGVQFNLTTTENTTVNNPPLYNFSNLTVAKTDSPDPVSASTNLTYVVNVTTTGNGTSYNITVNDTYPAQVIYLTSQPTPVTGTNNTWVLGNFTNGTSILVNITVLVRNISNGTVINNTANVTMNNETGGLLRFFGTQNTTVLNPPVYNTSIMTVAKTSDPDPVGINSQLNYTITVTAGGNGTSFNVTVNDTYPAGIVFNSAQPTPLTGTNNSWILGNLTNGTIILINITMNVPSLSDGIVLTNRVNVTYQNETSGNLSVVASSFTTVSNPSSSGGGGGGGSSGGGYYYGYSNTTNTSTTACFESWTCDSWSACINTKQTRSCSDLRGCGTTKLKPLEEQDCVYTLPPATLPKEAEPAAQPVAEPESLPETAKASRMPSLENIFYGISLIALAGLLVYLFILHRRNKNQPY